MATATRNYIGGIPLKFVKNPVTTYQQVNFGEDGGGYDVYIYGETEGSYVHWDASASTLYFVGAASIDVGASEDGVDTTFYGDTAGVTAFWDASSDAFIFTGADIQFGDGDKLVFGTGAGIAGDIQISFTDGTGLSIVGSAADEALLLGNDSYLLDITLKGDLTLTGDNAITVGDRTAGAGADLATVTTGVLAAVQYTDGAELANTYDYCGMAGIFDLTIGRAITLASGGGYGWAAVNGSVTISKAIASTGGLSAGWFAIWAEASGADAVLSESTRIQAIDASLVTGSAFNAGASTKVYGIRVDSSVHASATLSGEFAAIDIGKSSGKLDWTRGIDISDCTTGIYSANPIQVHGDANVIVGSRTAGSGADLGTVEEGLLVATQYTDAAAIANTTDYVGCAGIFDLKLGRAITLASGGGYGFATIWANLELDEDINSTGGQSAAWFSVWADASKDFEGVSRIQGVDIAIVAGAGEDFGASTRLYGLRIDSSVNNSATVDGEYAAIDIGKSGSNKDWKRAIDISGSDTGIYMADGFDHGIYFAADPQAGDVTNSFINIGDYSNAIAVAPTSANMFGVMHNVTMSTNVAYWYQAYYTKITTSGTTTNTSIAGHAYRMVVGSSLGAVYGVQCHTNITATNTCGTEIISGSFYVNLGTGSTTTTDRVCALQAMIEGSGGVVTGESIVAYIVNAGTASDTDSILEVKNQSACTATSGITLDLDGTCTYAFNFDGTVADGWSSGDVSAELGAFDEYALIPVKVEGITPTLYIMAAETWQSVD